MPNIDTFKAQFNNLARPNRFRITGFDLPPSLEFFAKGSQLPATNIAAMDVPYNGRVIKLDGDRTYEDLTLTVYGGETLEQRQAFEDWSNSMNEPVENITSAATNTAFKRDGNVILIDRKGVDIKNFSIRGALVTNIAAVDLDWSSNDTPLEFSVTLAYDYHLIV